MFEQRNESSAAQGRRFGHLLYSELDAIQKDPSRPPDDRIDAWEEEAERLTAAMTSVYTTEDEDA